MLLQKENCYLIIVIKCFKNKKPKQKQLNQVAYQDKPDLKPEKRKLNRMQKAFKAHTGVQRFVNEKPYVIWVRDESYKVK